jgi:uncharacterized protein (DUF1778 family)
MSQSAAVVNLEKKRARGARLGFRVDAQTKRRLQRAAAMEHRSLTDFCLTAVVKATEDAMARHEMLVLSDRDREVFFDTLVHPPRPAARLRHAFRAAERSVC